MRGLYAIVDLDALSARDLDPLRFARAVLCASPAALQLRAKHATSDETLRLLSALAPLCRAAHVPFAGNDSVELAVLGGCDLVHLGQGDMSLSAARRLAPNLGFGISTHTPEQLDLALGGHPTYVAFGPVYRTASKAEPDPEVGLAGLRQAAARVADFGRLQRQALSQLRQHNFHGVAIVGRPPVWARRSLRRAATAEGLKIGTHVVVLRVRDAAGNIGAAEAVFRVK